MLVEDREDIISVNAITSRTRMNKYNNKKKVKQSLV